MNEENVVETNEEQIQGVVEKTRNNVPAKEVSKWSMVIAAIWIGGLSLLKAFWGLIAKSPDPFGLSIKEIVFSGVALGFPRTRGGVSYTDIHNKDNTEFSPHTRGCFPASEKAENKEVVFPAHAGVFLQERILETDKLGFPRTRGGVSLEKSRVEIKGVFSPHTRGCFHKEVF